MVSKGLKPGHEQALSPTFSDLPMIYWDYFKGHTHPYDQVCEAATHSDFYDAQTTIISACSKSQET